MSKGKTQNALLNAGTSLGRDALLYGLAQLL